MQWHERQWRTAHSGGLDPRHQLLRKTTLGIVAHWQAQQRVDHAHSAAVGPGSAAKPCQLQSSSDGQQRTRRAALRWVQQHRIKRMQLPRHSVPACSSIIFCTGFKRFHACGLSHPIRDLHPCSATLPAPSPLSELSNVTSASSGIALRSESSSMRTSAVTSQSPEVKFGCCSTSFLALFCTQVSLGSHFLLAVAPHFLNKCQLNRCFTKGVRCSVGRGLPVGGFVARMPVSLLASEFANAQTLEIAVRSDSLHGTLVLSQRWFGRPGSAGVNGICSTHVHRCVATLDASHRMSTAMCPAFSKWRVVEPRRLIGYAELFELLHRPRWGATQPDRQVSVQHHGDRCTYPGHAAVAHLPAQAGVPCADSLCQQLRGRSLKNLLMDPSR